MPRLSRRHLLAATGAAVAVSGLAPISAAGRRPIYRGVGVGDPVLAREGRPLTDYSLIRNDWQADIVRISVHPGLWRDNQRGAKTALRRDVAAAREAGLAVIIVWHVIGWPDGRYERPAPQWHLPDNAYDSSVALAVSFWSDIAATYADDPQVIFELWNEPVNLDQMKEPINPAADWYHLRPIWQALLGVIRHHAGNQVLCTGGRWASDLTGIKNDPLEGSDIGYAWHVYPSTLNVYPHTIDGSIGYADWLLGDLHLDHPVFVTEWGFDPAGAAIGTAFADHFLTGQFDLSWTAWCWHPAWTPTLLQDDWRTPTAAGAFVRRLLAQ